MCGIAGFVGSGSRSDLVAMTDLQAHRGPDDDGFWETVLNDQRVCLGFRRLIVVDPRDGRQPMSTEDRNLTVVFNGEIYNHRQLRRQLETRGHTFRSDHSDTEVLLHGYREWGPELPHHLEGMFAFAIVDVRKSEIFLARDRFGKKPIYLGRLEWGFAFASELSALLAHSRVPQVVCKDAVARFFAFGYIPPPQTLYTGIRKLGAGQSATYSIPSGQLAVSTYWQPAIGGSRVRRPELKESATQLLTLLDNAVARRLEGDVPLGFFLSGGTDSAAIVALATKHLGRKNTQTFTISFEDKSYDEGKAARDTADALGTIHHERRFLYEDAEELVHTVLPKIDEPVADPSILPTYLLSRFAREHVTVALSGDGGDELFAGYDTFAARRFSQIYRFAMPDRAHALLRKAAGYLPNGTSNLSVDFLLRRWLRGVGEHPAFWDAIWLAPASLSEIAELTRAPVQTSDVYSDVFNRWEGLKANAKGDRQLDFYTRYYLQCGILAKVDRASMLNGLEVRSPFLDKDLFEFSENLPYTAKHKWMQQKRILRRAISAIVPKEVLARSKKGFGIPIAAWLRRLPMPDPYRVSTAGLDPQMLQRLWKEHASGKADHRGLLWAWMCLDACLSSANPKAN